MGASSPWARRMNLAHNIPAGGRIDARHRAVLPGLIDTHHHFLQNFLKGARDDLSFPDWIDQVSAPLITLAVSDYLAGHSELQRQATRLGCIEALKSGITTISEYGMGHSPRCHRRL